LNLDPRIASNGALHFPARDRDIAAILSRNELRLLVAIATAPSGLSRRELAAVLWGVPVIPTRRPQPLTPTQRASQARTLRRLESIGLVEIPGNVSLTFKGQRLVEALTRWPGWQDYARRWRIRPEALDRRVG